MSRMREGSSNCRTQLNTICWHLMWWLGLLCWTWNRFQKEVKATRRGRWMKMKVAYMKVSLFGLWVDTPFMISLMIMLGPFDKSCHFGHALSKGYWYANLNDKVAHGLTYASINVFQANIQKCITWLKKFGKGKQVWDNTCIDFGLRPRKLSTHIMSHDHVCDFYFNFWSSNFNQLHGL